MNSYPNSDSKQCPESKLGWVHRMHTQGTLATTTLRPGRVLGAVLWPHPAVSCRVAACTRALASRVAASRPAVSQPPPPPPPPHHDTKNRVVIQLLPLALRSRCAPCRACRSALHRIMAHCCAISQPLARHVVTPGLPPVTIQTIIS